VDLIADQDILKNIKLSCLCQHSNHDSSTVYSEPICCTDWRIADTFKSKILVQQNDYSRFRSRKYKQVIIWNLFFYIKFENRNLLFSKVNIPWLH
jgi:hypothetical protein